VTAYAPHEVEESVFAISQRVQEPGPHFLGRPRHGRNQGSGRFIVRARRGPEWHNLAGQRPTPLGHSRIGVDLLNLGTQFILFFCLP